LAKFYDIFNGDADGLCALQQLRLEEPRAAELVTGVKRELQLVERVHAKAGDELTVLDLNFADNAAAVQQALSRGATCRYFDHHTPGRLPEHPGFKAYIDTAPDVCTSLLVDRYLSGRQRLWAVVGAFGDNLVDAAVRAAQPLELDHTELARLHELGECLNYNAYGDTIDDLHYPPAELYSTMAPYRDPRHFIFDEPVFDVLRSAYVEDLTRAEEVRPSAEGPGYAVYIMPDAAWSRRVSGTYGNRLAQHDPQRAHAVLVTRGSDYVVSVRAPVARPAGASALCKQFATGGGREGAGGINRLPQRDLDRFIAAFRAAYE
jgi:hypothetical protein